MLISFTGAQSSGKTTLLRECCNRSIFRKYHFVEEVTRKVARDQNVDINEQGGDVTQLFILNEHLHNHFIRGNALLDRSILDGWVYTRYLHEENQISDWIMELADNLYELLLPKIDILFYTDPRDVPIHDDGQRSINHEFRDRIIHGFEDKLPEITTQHPEIKVVRLLGDISTRMQTILDTIKNNDNNIG